MNYTRQLKNKILFNLQSGMYFFMTRLIGIAIKAKRTSAANGLNRIPMANAMVSTAEG